MCAKYYISIILSLFLSCVASLAQQIVTENGKAYKLHKVAKGEGFYRLSKDNGVSQEDILAANPELKNTGLVEGVTIKIPLKSSNSSTSSSSTSDSAKTKTTYTIKQGDTMYSICKAHNMSISEFLDINSISTKDIQAGQIVYVYATATSGYVIHTLKSGETLYSVGTLYGVKAQDIIDANASLDVTNLPIGTAIRIPVSTIPEEDSNFYYHRIANGETLYSLCVKYDLLQENIKEYNPDIDWNKLSIGQIVAVPKSKEQQVTYTYHDVVKKETLYSIAKMENVTQDEILNSNPGVTADNLQKGMKLRIPHYVAGPTPATADPSYIGYSNDIATFVSSYDYVALGRPQINVFLMLPFNAYSEMEELRSSGVNTNTNSYAFKSRRYVEFYEGVRLALDSLAEAGANINLTVYDTNNRLEAINSLNTASVTPDIIIGPAHKAEMSDVMSYAAQKKVSIILPFAQCDSSILDNPYIIQASVIDSITTKEIYEKMTSNLSGTHVIMLQAKNRTKTEVVRASVLRKLCERNDIDLTEFVYNTADPQNFLAQLSTEKRNVILFPTSNEATANSILTSIAGVIEQLAEAEVELWVTSEWLTFQTIEVDVFHRLTTRVFTTYAVDDKDSHTRWILNKYRKQYSTEPIAFTPYFERLKKLSGYSEYGLWGYDIALQFVGARLTLGPQFVRNINAYKPSVVQSNFRFRNLTNWGGSVNVGLKTITFNKNGTVEVNNIE